MDPWAQDRDQRGLGREGNRHLRGPRTQGGLEGSHRQERQDKSWGHLEEGMHPDRLVRTSRCLLLADLRSKAHLDKVQEVLPGRREMVRSGRRRGLQVAVLELLQAGTAQGTAQGLQDWRGTALEHPVETVPESQDQGGNRQALRGVLGTGLVLRDQSERGTAPEPPGQTIHQGSHWERRAGRVPLGPNQAIRGWKQAEGWWREQTGLCSQLS